MFDLDDYIESGQWSDDPNLPDEYFDSEQWNSDDESL